MIVRKIGAIVICLVFTRQEPVTDASVKMSRGDPAGYAGQRVVGRRACWTKGVLDEHGDEAQ